MFATTRKPRGSIKLKEVYLLPQYAGESSCKEDLGLKSQLASKEFVFCAQEIESSSKRRIALGVSQHCTDSLSLVIAEDFHRARFALDHCPSNRPRDVSEALLSKPPREFPDLFRGA
jgi:hypothetical protein